MSPSAVAPASPPLMYRPEEAATVLGISRSRIFELLAAGSLPSIKLGRSRRITREALEAYVGRLASEQAPQPATGSDPVPARPMAHSQAARAPRGRSEPPD